MKYDSKRPAAIDKDKSVYQFAFGIEEIQLLQNIIIHYRKNIPRTIETNIMLNRLGNFEKTLNKFFKERNNEKWKK